MLMYPYFYFTKWRHLSSWKKIFTRAHNWFYREMTCAPFSCNAKGNRKWDAMRKSPIKFITTKNVCRPVQRNIPALIVLLIFDNKIHTLVICYVRTMYINDIVEKDIIFSDFWIIIFFTKRGMKKTNHVKGDQNAWSISYSL